jgi:membrane-associated PAP2 superfamily phosphatase
MSVKVSAGISRSIWYLLIDRRACAIARNTAALLLEVAVMIGIFVTVLLMYGIAICWPWSMVDGRGRNKFVAVFRAKCLMRQSRF